MVKTNDVFTLTKIGYALHFRPFGMVMVMVMVMMMMMMTMTMMMMMMIMMMIMIMIIIIIMNQWIQCSNYYMYCQPG